MALVATFGFALAIPSRWRLLHRLTLCPPTAPMTASISLPVLVEVSSFWLPEIDSTRRLAFLVSSCAAIPIGLPPTSLDDQAFSELDGALQSNSGRQARQTLNRLARQSSGHEHCGCSYEQGGTHV
jgi:hypothetical protein